MSSIPDENKNQDAVELGKLGVLAREKRAEERGQTTIVIKLPYSLIEIKEAYVGDCEIFGIKHKPKSELRKKDIEKWIYDDIVYRIKEAL